MNVIKPTRIYAQNNDFQRSVSATCRLFSVSPLINEEEINENFQIEENLFQIDYSQSPSRPSSPSLDQKKCIVTTEE